MKKLIALCSILFISISCFAVSSGTFTVMPAGGGNYTSLIAAEAGLNGDLIAPCTIQCSNGIDNQGNNYLTISGWTTYPTAYLLIEVPQASRHRGVWNDNYYQVISSYAASGNGTIHIVEENVRIDGLQIQNSTGMAGRTQSCIIFPIAALPTVCDLRISNCIIRCINKDGVGSLIPQGGGIRFAQFYSTVTLRAWNNVFFDQLQGGILFTNTLRTPSTLIAYNNTFYECAISTYYSNTSGFAVGGSTDVMKIVMKNNLVSDTTRCYGLPVVGYANFISSNNISSDQTSPNIPYRKRTVNFVDATNRNLQPLSTDTTAYAQGVNLNPDPDGWINVTLDIAGNTRPAVPTIGAFERQASAVSVPARRRYSSVIYKD